MIWINFGILHLTLFFGCIFDRGDCSHIHRFHLVYLKTNAKCCRNFIKSLERDFTCTFDSTIKNVFLNGVGPHLQCKKVSLACITDNLFIVMNSKDETWIEVGWKQNASVTSMRTGWNNFYNLLNLMLKVWGAIISAHVLNVLMVDDN